MNSRTRTASFILTLTVLFFGLICQAQNPKGNKDAKDKNASSGSRQTSYSTGIGLRMGLEGGLTVKHFLSNTSAVEGIFSRGWGYGGFRITGLYEIQKSLPNAKGFDWFFGGGVHIGFYNGAYYGYYGNYGGSGYYDNHGNWHNTGYRSNYTTFGIDGILGLEYQFTGVPITMSIDIKPYFDFIGRGNHYGDGAFSIRYVLK